MTRTKIFISYSHKDRKWLERLQLHLKPLEYNIFIDLWDDTKIDTGEKWREEIQSAIDSAKIAVLLVSAEFLASDFIIKEELPLLLAAEPEGMTIFPVIITPCRYDDIEELSKFEAVNDPSKTLIEMNEGEVERVWVKLTQNIISKILLATSKSSLDVTEENKKSSVLRGQFSKSKIELKIDLEIENFDKRYQQLLLYGIANFLDISPDYVKITSIIKSNSIVVTLELPEEAAKNFLQDYNKNKNEISKHVYPIILSNAYGIDITEGKRVSKKSRSKNLLKNCILSNKKNILGISVEDSRIVMALVRMNDIGESIPYFYNKVLYENKMIGMLPSIEQISNAIKNAYLELKRNCSLPYEHIFLGIPSWNLVGRDYSYEMTISPPFSKITTRSIERLESWIRRVYIPDNYVIIDIIHKSFIIDGNKTVISPIDMIAEKLSLNTHMIISEAGLLESLLDCIKDIGLKIDIIVSPFVAGAAGALTRQEMETGVVLVDIGELFTTCSFFYNGTLFDTEIIKFGNHNISKNIENNTGVSHRDIENVIEGRKNAFLEGQQSENALLIPHMHDGFKIQQLPMKQIKSIMHLSSEQLLDSLIEALKISKGRLDFATSGLVFIGEKYYPLRGILDLIRNRINLPARIGYPSDICCVDPNNFQEFQDPSFVKLFGLIKHGYAKRHNLQYYLKKYNKKDKSKISKFKKISNQ